MSGLHFPAAASGVVDAWKLLPLNPHNEKNISFEFMFSTFPLKILDAIFLRITLQTFQRKKIAIDGDGLSFLQIHMTHFFIK